MKNFKISLLFAFFTLHSFGQITFENSYSLPSGLFATDLSIINLTNGGHKYVLYNEDTIQIYSLAHTLEKTITLPPINVPNWGSGQSNATAVKFISAGHIN